MKLVFFILIFSFSLFSSAQEVVVLSIQEELITNAHQHLIKGEEEAVKKLIVSGQIDINESRHPTDGRPLLHRAVEFGMYDTVEFLLRHGVDVKAVDGQKKTALHRAVSASNAYRDVDIVELLLEHHADVEARDAGGRTPLNLLASVAYNVMRDEHISTVLLDHGADVDAADAGGRTPLFRAASVKHRRGEGIAKLLLERGADIDARVMDWQGKRLTALSVAIKSFNRPMVNVLLRHGANPNMKIFGRTGSVDFAFLFRDITVAGWLLAHGGDQEFNPYLEGISDFIEDYKKGVIQSGTNPESLRRQVEFMENYKERVIQPLLKEAERLETRAFSVLSQNQFVKTPPSDVADFLFAPNLDLSTERFLHEAARRGDLEVATALLREGDADPSEFINEEAAALVREGGVDVNETNLAGETPLFEALRVRNLSMAELLVRAGADVHHWNYLGDTLLHQVLRRGLKEDLVIAKWLLEQGVDINAQNLFGDTALHEAAFDERLQVLNFLLQNGASKRIQNHLGLTPADIANFKAFNNGGRVVSMLGGGGDDIHCGY